MGEREKKEEKEEKEEGRVTWVDMAFYFLIFRKYTCIFSSRTTPTHPTPPRQKNTSQIIYSVLTFITALNIWFLFVPAKVCQCLEDSVACLLVPVNSSAPDIQM